MICIIPIGSTVQLKQTNIDGIVTSAIIGKRDVVYIVTYWSEGEPCEIQVIEDQIIYNDDTCEMIV